MKLKSISGVLLAYHEEKVIENSCRKLMGVLESLADQAEVIVVGVESCKDQTNEIVKRMGLVDPRYRLVIQPSTERGYGRAFALGIEAANHEWVFQSDADAQYEFRDIAKLAEKVTDQVDFVHGYREHRQDPFERIIMAGMYNIALRLIYRLPIRDVDSAFKLIRNSKIKAFKIVSRSGFAVAELVVRFRASHSKFVQIPVTHYPRTEGEPLAEKGVKNPFGLQIPSFKLIRDTLGEMWNMRKILP